jgi:sulfotransferase family protein
VNPFVFVVGAPRSGTTLLKRVLDAHPELTITKETHWIVQLLDGEHAASADAPVTPELLERLLSHRRFARLKLDHAPLEQLVARPEPVSYAELVTAVYDLWGAREGKRLVGDKTPRYVRHIPTLHELWPGAKFVHLIRDGRDVCSSVRSWRNERRVVTRFSTFAEDPVTTIAVWWEQLVRLGREAGAELPPELYHEVRYESLVGEPADTCTALCGFLGLRFDERMLRFHEGRAREDPGLDAKSAWRPITAGLRSWRTELSEAELERFEAVAGELLDELGYPRAVDEPGPEAMEQAALVRESYVREAGRQRLPAAWAR